MLCNDCKSHSMKFLITESNQEREVWKCMKCGYKEELPLWESTKTDKKGN